MRKAVLDVDCIELALACAEYAADTACRADLLDLRAPVLVGALDRDEMSCRDKLYETSGTCLCAKSASHTFRAVDGCNPVLDGDGILRTDSGA